MPRGSLCPNTSLGHEVTARLVAVIQAPRGNADRSGAPGEKFQSITGAGGTGAGRAGAAWAIARRAAPARAAPGGTTEERAATNVPAPRRGDVRYPSATSCS